MADIKTCEQSGESNAPSVAVVMYLLFSLIISVMAGFNAFESMHIPETLGFIKRTVWVIMAVVAGTPFGVIGGLIGGLLRNIACPSAILTGGMIDTLWKRLFWAIGPQSIGVFFGTGLGLFLASELFKKFFV